MKKETVIGAAIGAIGTLAVIGKGIVDGIKSAPDLRTQKLKKEFLEEFDNVKENSNLDKAVNALYAYMYRMCRIENTDVTFNMVQRFVCLHCWDKVTEQLRHYEDSILFLIYGRADAMLIGASSDLSEKAKEKIQESIKRNEKENSAILKIESAFFDEIVGISTDETRAAIREAKRCLIDEIGYSNTEVRAVMQKLRENAKNNVEKVKQTI